MARTAHAKRYFLRNCVVIYSFENGQRVVYLDENKWNYSETTSIYRNQFLGETTKETEAKIKNGTYKLVDLN